MSLEISDHVDGTLMLFLPDPGMLLKDLHIKLYGVRLLERG